ncbi:RNA 2',3'-cyclic phosphodiesterase [Sporosarcina aquimarina]|uniref:RNA 2',3'-cyclic phosphodiesterase n=1 Tax=Sporosarcina aquimarina TaxID=114975 RepID=A0ABU4FZW2_9BACL|nr:RNA 2',3'-cyclic phosphodiesterase [Sporosarcina aquimarina]MDW0110250.1 RNA 2',3'-cyclic phosphodiesterase [Sporosarcina aquimarina]
MTHYFVAIPIPFGIVAEPLKKASAYYELSSHYKVIPHPDDLHITLLFFGALTPLQLDFVKQELEVIAKNTESFTVTIDGISFFGNPTGPRVVYLSVQPELQLAELYHALGKRLEFVLQKPASLEYTPHITIAKKKKDNNPHPIETEHFPPLLHSVKGITLFSIDPASSPKYRPAETFSFD